MTNLVYPSGQVFCADIAFMKAYGIEEAFLIHHFQHWIRVNKKHNKNFKDGRTWSYQTIQYIADHFDFLTYERVKYALEKLVQHGVLMKGNYNKSPIDKTCWYAFVNENIFVPDLEENSKNVYERENSLSIGKIPSSIPDTKSTDTKENLSNHHHTSSKNSSTKKEKAGGGEEEKKGERERDISYTTTKGEKKSISQSEIYRHFSKLEYATALIKEAIEILSGEAAPVNSPIKYLEAVVKRLATKPTKKVNSKTEIEREKQKAREKNRPPKNTQPGVKFDYEQFKSQKKK